MILSGTGTIQSQFLPPLTNSVSGTLVAAFSLRKVRSAYAGSAVRVRRSSDNAESDIGFDANGNFNTSALTSFVGANNGRVVTWYDQSGNARHFTNSSTTTQPVIYDSVIGPITDNGRPTISFAGYGFESTSQWFASADLYASVVINHRTGTAAASIISSRAATFDSSPGMFYVSGPALNIASSFGGCGAFNNTNQLVGSAEWDENVNSYLYMNDVLQSGPCTNGTYTNKGTYTVLGAPRYGEAYDSNFTLQELVVYSSLMISTGQDAIISANQRKYYSIA